MRPLLLTSRYALGMIMQQALLFVLVPLCTGYLSPGQLGAWALLQITVTLLIQVVAAPVGSALTRFYYHPKFKDQSGRLGFTLLSIYGIQTLALAGLYLLGSDALNRLLFEGEGHLGEVRAFTLVLLTVGTSMLLMNFLQLIEAAWSFVILSVVQAVVTTAVSLVLLVSYGWGIYALIVGQAVGQGLQIIGAILILAGRMSPKLDGSIIRTPLKYGYLSLPAAYGGVLIQTTDRYVINVLASTAHVGLYAFGSLMANLITIAFARPFIKGITPLVHQLEDRPDRQRAFITKIALYGSWVGTWFAVAIGCFGKEMVQLLAQSPEYYAAWTVIPVLVFARVLQPISGVMGMGLHFANRPGITSLLTLTIAALNLVVSIALVPVIGIIGAAVGTLIAMLTWAGINAHLALKHYDLRFTSGRILAGMLLGGLFVCFAVMTPASWPDWLGLLTKSSCVAAYPVGLLACGVVTRSDVDVLRQMYRQARHRGLRGLVVVFLTG